MAVNTQTFHGVCQKQVQSTWSWINSVLCIGQLCASVPSAANKAGLHIVVGSAPGVQDVACKVKTLPQAVRTAPCHVSCIHVTGTVARKQEWRHTLTLEAMFSCFQLSLMGALATSRPVNVCLTPRQKQSQLLFCMKGCAYMVLVMTRSMLIRSSPTGQNSCHIQRQQHSLHTEKRLGLLWPGGHACTRNSSY